MASAETKVGLLVLVALGGLGWLSMQSGVLNESLQRESRQLETAFTDVQGLLIGAPVRIAGVDVGTVKDIQLAADGRAIVQFSVEREIPLPASVQARITSDGIIGQKFLNLVAPAGAAQAGKLAADVQQIPSMGAASSDNLAGNFGKIAADLEAITGALKTALGGPENAQKLANIVNNFEGFSSRLDQVLNEEVQEGSIRQIVSNLQESTQSLKTILSGNEAQTGEMIANFSETAANLKTVTDRLVRGEGLLGQMTVEGGIDGDGLITDLRTTLQDFRQVAQKINSGEGTVGKLINEPDVADKLESTLTSFSEAANRLEQLRTEVDINTAALTNEGIAKSEFALTLRPRPTRYYHFGVTMDGFASEAESNETVNPFPGREFGEEVKFTAQFGHVFQNLIGNQDIGMRLGLKDSTGGIGFDTVVPAPFDWRYLDDQVALSTDIYDFGGANTNESDVPHWDVKAKWRWNVLDKQFYTTIGYDNILNQEYGSPMIGAGFKFEDDDLKHLVGAL